MTYKEAKEYVKNNGPYYKGCLKDGSCALLRIRNKCLILPEFGVNGRMRDGCEWAYININGKVDTGLYGDVYYF